MLGRGKRNRELDAAIRELTDADTVAFGGVGIASTLLAVTEAYRTVERMLPEQGEQIRPRLDRLLTDGSPAGRAYAATLLDRLDPAAGRAAWSGLRDDSSEFTTFTGCVMGRATLADYAADRLR